MPLVQSISVSHCGRAPLAPVGSAAPPELLAALHAAWASQRQRQPPATSKLSRAGHGRSQGMFRAAVPSGASTGIYEAVELRDGDKAKCVPAVDCVGW